jgi:hypothetical protein
MTDVALFILSNVVVERDTEGAITASGGICDPHDPWHIDDGTLIPLGFSTGYLTAGPELLMRLVAAN